MFRSYGKRSMFHCQRTDNSALFCLIPLTFLSVGKHIYLAIATEDAEQAHEEVYEVQEQPERAEQRNAVQHIRVGRRS